MFYYRFGVNAKIIHFIGNSKPWLQYFNTETRLVQPSLELHHLQGVLQHWWNIFCSLIHPNLSMEMVSDQANTPVSLWLIIIYKSPCTHTPTDRRNILVSVLNTFRWVWCEKHVTTLLMIVIHSGIHYFKIVTQKPWKYKYIIMWCSVSFSCTSYITQKFVKVGPKYFSNELRSFFRLVVLQIFN